jgi:Bacterial aa3 type cytochrome c oxidase subunit IV
MTIDTSNGHKAMDYPEHQRTYAGFLRGTVVLCVVVALLLIGMLVFLVP